MKQRFSSRLLRRLRNDIPIEVIIEEVLQLPIKNSEGHFRFLCPICLDFNTATMQKTNLGRCFRCGRNYNPIDIMITVAEIPFAEAVKKLTPLLRDD